MSLGTGFRSGVILNVVTAETTLLKRLVVGLKEVIANERLGKTDKLEMLERPVHKVLVKAQ